MNRHGEERLIMNRIGITLVAFGACGTAAHAQDREIDHGRELLEQLCSRCHAIGKTGVSPHADAPPFRTFGEQKLYDDNLLQRLQDGLESIHRDMPTFRFSHDDGVAVIHYLQSIQEPRKAK
jgi:cytochrome c